MAQGQKLEAAQQKKKRKAGHQPGLPLRTKALLKSVVPHHATSSFDAAPQTCAFFYTRQTAFLHLNDTLTIAIN
jgi:hypothetical protein